MKNQKYIKKPIPIEAIRLDKVFPIPSKDQLEYSASEVVPTGIEWVDEVTKTKKVYCDIVNDEIHVETLEGTMRGGRYDYLIHGVNGEIYICEKSIFEKTYDPID